MTMRALLVEFVILEQIACRERTSNFVDMTAAAKRPCAIGQGAAHVAISRTRNDNAGSWVQPGAGLDQGFSERTHQDRRSRLLKIRFGSPFATRSAPKYPSFRAQHGVVPQECARTGVGPQSGTAGASKKLTSYSKSRKDAPKKYPRKRSAPNSVVPSFQPTAA